MIGTILSNRYELLEKIGEGGMAEVYKAKCHKLNRFDAVKILKREFANDKELVEKFKREATAVANLSDNNIINIFDVGTQGDINYIVMEYVKGKTLKDIIVENVRLSYERSIDIAIQIARALDCAHRNNIIHRDVKPQNILVTDDGIVKVTDFGIAKAPTSVTITNSNKVMGSAHYFSPEQARGGFIDARTDIYSLGIVIYEMVTGKVPYDAESPVSVALKHIQEPVVPPRHIVPGIPESINRLILKAIEKDPVRRYQTVKEMLIDLLRIQKDMNYDVIPSNVDDDYTKVMSPVNVNSSSGDDILEEVKRENAVSSKTKKTIIFSLLAVVVIIIGAIMGWLASRGGANPEPKNTPSSSELKVPDIVGLPMDEAKKVLEEKGLKLVVIDQENSDKPEGTVLKTWPDIGTSVQPDTDVRVRVSEGAPLVEVPGLVEIDLNSAKEIIQNFGFELGDVEEEFSSTVPANSVISQDPEEKTLIEKGTKINLVVSKGPEKIEVPDLTGKTLTEAENMLKNLGLVLGTDKTEVQTDDESQDGKISAQDPLKGEKVDKSAAVNVSYYVYSASTKITINTDFSGMTAAGAKAELLKLSNKFNITIDGDENAPVSSVKSGDLVLGPDVTVESNASIVISTSSEVSITKDYTGMKASDVKNDLLNLSADFSIKVVDKNGTEVNKDGVVESVKVGDTNLEAGMSIAKDSTIIITIK